MQTVSTITSASRAAATQLSLVLPAYNEGLTIESAIREAVTALNSLGVVFEVLVVDDGSTDDTSAIARRVADGLPEVRVLTLPANRGYGEALRHGFREARFDLVAFTDADCQFNLRELDRLLWLTRSADLVCGFRVGRQDPWSRKLYSRGFNLLVRTLLRTGVDDCDCALKVLRRDWVNSAKLTTPGFFFNAELLARARQDGLVIAEVGVSHRQRKAGVSKVSIGHVWPVLLTLFQFWWSQVAFARPAATPTNRLRDIVVALGLAAIAGFVLLPNLSFPFFDPDETRYAEIAREMLVSGDYLVPKHLGMPYFDKPPLLYWLTAASYRVFGVTEYAARLVSVTAALGTVCATFWLGRAVVGSQAACMGAVLELLCGGFLISARFLFIDSLFAFLTTVTLLAGYAASRDGTFRRGYWVIAAVACGLGLLAKGPVIIALCLPPLWLSCYLTTGRSPLSALNWLQFAVIGGVVSLPWFAAIIWNHRDFLDSFLITHHWQRFTGGLSHAEPWWFYIPVLLIGMLPCSILFPAVVATMLLMRGGRTQRHRTWDSGFLLLATGWIVAFFSLSSCKLPPYLLPVVPPLCLATASILSPSLAGITGIRFLDYVSEWSPRDLSLIGLLAIAATSIVDALLLPESTDTRQLSYATLGAAGVLILVMFNLKVIAISFRRWSLTTAYLLSLLTFGIWELAPAVARSRTSAGHVGTVCRALQSAEIPTVCFALANEVDSFAFYLRPHGLRSFDPHDVDGALAALKSHPRALLLANTAHAERLFALAPPSLRVIEAGRHKHIGVWQCEHSTVERAALGRSDRPQNRLIMTLPAAGPAACDERKPDSLSGKERLTWE